LLKSIDLDSIKAAWKNESSFEDHRLSELDIENFLSSKSKDISQLFRKGLIFDIVLKSVIGVSLIGIFFLLKASQSLVLVSYILMLILWAIRYQWLMISKIPKASTSDPVIRISLENKIKFYRRHFIKSLYVGALSNSLFILSGMLYYLYFKYGEIRPFAWDDYLVFGVTIFMGFALGAYIQITQHSFQVKQLENCLQDIDEDAMTTLTLRDQRNKRRRLILIILLAMVCGLLLLAFFIFK
jgi:hypothetical protein